MVYFDHNATTPLCPEAKSAWVKANEEAWMNPSSPYPAATRARYALDAAREELADLLHARPEEIVFTSGATEAANLVLGHFVRQRGHTLLIGATEHPCIRESAQGGGAQVERLPVQPDGRTDPEQLAERLRTLPRASLVAIMAANNETGTENDVEAIVRVCREAQVPFLCDAVQWIGKRPLAALRHADGLLASAHKFGGPKGVGFARLGPALGDVRGARGGQQEGGRRAGTENYPGISAMLAALRSAQAIAEDPQATTIRKAWRSHFVERMRGLGFGIAGSETANLWNTVLLLPPVGERMRWVMRLAKHGFAVSTGSACSTGRESASSVLQALGFPDATARRAIRISSGRETRESDWQDLADAIENTLAELSAEKEPATVIQI